MRARKVMQFALRGVSETAAGALESSLTARGVEVVGRRTFDSTGDTRVVVAFRGAARAASVLREALMEFTATPVVVAPLGEPAVKYHLLMELAHAGILVSYFYALAPFDRPRLAVFKTDDDARALQVIRESPWEQTDAADGGVDPEAPADCEHGCEQGVAT